MKKFIFLSLLFTLMIPSFVGAQFTKKKLNEISGGAVVTAGAGGFDALAQGSPWGIIGSSDHSLPARLGALVMVAMQFLGVIALVIIVYAGFLWMTAGDSDRVGKAKKWLLNGVIGLIIITSAYAIASFAVSSLTREPAPPSFPGPSTTGSGG